MGILVRRHAHARTRVREKREKTVVSLCSDQQQVAAATVLAAATNINSTNCTTDDMNEQVHTGHSEYAMTDRRSIEDRVYALIDV